ncbi:nuclear pore complex protein Nup153 isoform X24 [Danio rerio]|uniref:Nuclear pore complex protein Nup153 isoform X24 n=1 Tax=Danio rerio TaxID=7955 RepID=A0AC58HYW4_DANRE
MAATGGGKIRSRRHHIASKPYAKGKQPGLITRVTDTVKSIVPSWLQKYFRNGEGPEGGASAAGVEHNNMTPPPNGSDEAPLRDGRDSPEPSTSNTEPSTSRASLNFQEALSRPPLNRTHLQFPSLDGSPALGGSSSLFSQPSTSTAPFSGSPFAVTSNFSLVKEIKDSSSQHEDDNISTTSGFSSRASDKETERTHSGSQTAHSGLKKPAFNLSVFGTSSSSVLNSSVLNSSQLGDSPFYPGKTTYGGASAMRTARSRPATPYQPPVRRQIKAKPTGAQPCGVTSATARRILQSLERMSSPLADAKRIPSTVSSPLSASLNHTDLDISNYQAKRKRLEPSVPPVQKLVVPAAAAVSGNRSISFRPSLTPGGVSRGVEKTSRETPVRQSPPISEPAQAPPPSTSTLSYPLSSTPAANSAALGGGKMKRERAIRPSSKRPDDEVAEEPDLPPASLPSNFTLPTFTFSTPPPTSSLKSSTAPLITVSEEPAANKQPAAPSTPPSAPFTFSSPIVKATAASPPSFSPSSGFTFSAPTMKMGPSFSNGKIVPSVAPVKSVVIEEKEFEGPFKPAKVLKQGSVLDILKGPGFASPSQNSTDKPLQSTSTTTSSPFSGFGDKFRPPAGSWNCGTCMLQNKPSDKKCVACLAPQPNTDSSKSDSKPAEAPASISSLFAPPAGSWECDTCLVSNKPDAVKCVACDTAKPGTGVKSSLTLLAASESSSSTTTTATTTAAALTSTGLLGLGDKFKKPEGAWDCDVCMVQNKAQDLKCVACLTAKPGAAAAPLSTPASAPVSSAAPLLGFGDKFKKPEGSWECDVCCVQNKADDQQCVACQSAKPGAKIESKGFSSSFGVQSNSTDSNTSGFKFGTGSTDSSSSSAGLKFGGTFSDSSTTGGIKFGFGLSSTSSEGFKFGGSSSDAGGAKLSSTLSESTATKESSTKSFAFGGSADDTLEKKSKTQESNTGFKFGGGSGMASGSENSSFLFGAKPSEKGSSNPSFSFPVPQSKVEKDAPSETPPVSNTTTTTTAANALPVFGKSLVAESSAPKFGEPATKEQTLVTSTFTFGKPEEKKDTSAPSSTFLFGSSKEAEKPTPNLGFAFSEPDPPKDFPKPALTFGKPAESTEPPKPSFGFGQSLTAPAPSANPSPFVFSSAAPSSGFGSGQTPIFGQSASQPSAPAFGSAAPSFSASATPASTFGAKPSSAPVFGQQANAAPTFGSTAASTGQGGFQFGSTGGFGASATSNSVFNFGGGSAAPAASPAMPALNPPAGGGFGFSPTPAFNIGSAKSSFTASPAGQNSIAGRKIKTAVRRRK